MTLRNVLGRLVIAVCGALVASVAVAQRVELKVYGSIEIDEVEEWVSAFEKANPDIRLTLVRGSTGVLTARILAEASAPQADVIWRLAESSLVQLEQRGLLVPHAPAPSPAGAPLSRSRSNPPAWVTHVGYMGALCVNLPELRALGVPTPQSWRDLLDPRLKGRIVMPSPASSGTGLLHLASWLSRVGEAAGWEYVKALDGNVAYYTTSGSKPCALAAAGEHAVGLSFSTRAMLLKQQGAPIDVVFPAEGVGRDIEGSAILAGTTQPAAARRFMDWVTGPQAAVLYSRRYPLHAPVASPPLPFHPERPQALLVPIDAYELAAQRDAWIRRWESTRAARVER